MVLSAIGAAALAGVLAAPGSAGRSTTTSYVFTTSMSQITAGSNNSGSWSPTHKNTDSNDNYFTGGSFGILFRDYFTFDISAMPSVCPPQSAVLTIPSGPNEFSGYPFLTLGLFDVSTDAQMLAHKSAGPNAAIYDDLGSGTGFGSYLLPTSSGPNGTSFELQLNKPFVNAFAQAARAHRRWFSIGGSVIDTPPGDANFFGFTNDHEVVTLTVKTPRLCRV